MSPDQLRQRLEFYQDLGIKQIYKRSAEPVPEAAPIEITPLEMKNIPADIQLPSLVPADDSLERISADIGDCKRCRLCKDRNKIVFGVGDPGAKLVFVGEGPGGGE